MEIAKPFNGSSVHQHEIDADTAAGRKELWRRMEGKHGEHHAGELRARSERKTVNNSRILTL